jgi:L-threonylcarbamoyladenylate synthase
VNDLKNDIDQSLEVLRKGGIILYPTDTVWGLGCDATNPAAIERIMEIKQRNDSKGMIVLLENPNFILSYIDEMPEVAWDLIEYCETPTTIIFDKAKNVAPNLPAPDGSIGIRITREEFTQRLLQRFRKPLVSTSANLSGMPTPGNFDQISDQIKSKVDYIVKYRQEDKTLSKPSSVIKLGASGLIKIIR